MQSLLEWEKKKRKRIWSKWRLEDSRKDRFNRKEKNPMRERAPVHTLKGTRSTCCGARRAPAAWQRPWRNPGVVCKIEVMLGEKERGVLKTTQCEAGEVASM